MRAKSIPIGATMKYGTFIATEGNYNISFSVSSDKVIKIFYIQNFQVHWSYKFLEFDALLEKFTLEQMKINKCKRRTARGKL